MHAHTCLFSLWGNQSRSMSMKRAQMSELCTGWRLCWKVLHLSFVAPWPFLYVPHPVSLLRTGWPVEPIRNVHLTGWHHVYLWPWDRTVATCNQTSAMAISPPSLGSSISSSGRRPGAGDISPMLIWLHSPPLATSSLSLPLSVSFFLSCSLSDVEIWFGESREESSISIQLLPLSLALFIPFSSALLSFQLSTLSLSLSLSTSFLSLSSVQS